MKKEAAKSLHNVIDRTDKERTTKADQKKISVVTGVFLIARLQFKSKL